tara:strand:- start:38 stop:454 length:417 start_codon:yes stop_codon:yes gene_type:complete
MKPKIIKEKIFLDDRGFVRTLSNLKFKKIKRIYFVNNFKKNFIRAWHAHKKESKYAYVLKGTVMFGAVNLKNNKVSKFFIDEKIPKLLFIPPNYANGFMNLSNDSIVMFLSDKTLNQSLNDDIRFPYDKWNIWGIKNR